MQEIKLLALDIDGTLIADMGMNVAPRDMDAIKRARAAGVYVTLATGRILETAKRWIHALRIDLPIIICNGADIRDGEKSWFRDSIPKEATRDIMAAYRGTGQKRYIFSDNKIYCTKDDYYQVLFDKWQQGEEAVFPVVIKDTEEEMYREMYADAEKVLVWSPVIELEPQLRDIAQTFAGKYNVVRGEERNVEFNKLGVSKGSGLKKLAELLGVQMEQVMAIGDGGNDVEMLRAAGVGVAMENAMEEARAAADYITADVRECGVAQAIDRFVFGK
ncbi:Cof-type HAD-IIB family hydrolase [Christensenella tenuis]|jgi:Cof subfamily protein (haloacid dehalogenase superfamily)|uniref:HAD family phosphatase n=1 Tax=Christensenella tenuis TaxID=2763033 RepID=A0ABR7EJT5_9FIRM|nr:Cof-type HAD-IIB family hydrolase [Christensenella tenuis]MBC5649399.1 HAD family phosphatase [Christensenella tenuis]